MLFVEKKVAICFKTLAAVTSDCDLHEIISGHQDLTIRTQMASETIVIFNQSTRLTDREHFINFSHRESFRYYSITFQ
jgi:hypothetical protein